MYVKDVQYRSLKFNSFVENNIMLLYDTNNLSYHPMLVT